MRGVADANELKSFAAAGRFENRLVLGGQFLQLDFRGTFQGQEYTRMGLLGLNRVTNEFVESWFDILGNVYFLSASKYEVTVDMVRLQVEFRHPFTGEISRNTCLYAVQGDAAFSHSITNTKPDGTETILKATKFSRA